MNLALLELRRRPGRFATAALILFLLAALLQLLGGLSNGLNGGRDGAIRAQPVDLLVYGSSAERSVPQSQVSAADAERIAAVEGVAEVGSLRLSQLAVRRDAENPRDLIDVTVLGSELLVDEVDSIAPGTAVADSTLRDRGVEQGDTILLGPARTPVTVTGFVDDSAFIGQPSVWVAVDTFDTVVAANKPDEILPPGDQQVVQVRLAEGADPTSVAAAIDTATGSTETLTRADAAAAIEPIDGGTLQTIIYFTTGIAVAVVALFFALLTSERLGLYGVLKAIGARNATLFAGVLVQAVVLALVGVAVATPLAMLFDALVPPAAIPFALDPAQMTASAVLLVVASALGAGFSLRRVLRVEPASVIGTAS